MLKYIEDEQPNLEDMQEYVGGYIETLSLTNGYTMVINEDGRQQNLKHNPEATKIYQDNGGLAGMDIVGNAMIVKDSLLK
jgi:hypothetical protein|tara:strand:- start:622 stop:861 length:240 start_codon:yes stop_codon:yes gene_type:complete